MEKNYTFRITCVEFVGGDEVDATLVVPVENFSLELLLAELVGGQQHWEILLFVLQIEAVIKMGNCESEHALEFVPGAFL